MFQQNSSTQGKHTAARGIGTLFGLALFALSAITSASFFYAHAAGPFTPFAGEFSPLLAAAAGVLLYEGASVLWGWLRANDADTHQQLTVSSIGAWFGLVGGILVTAVYFALNNDLITLDAQTLYLSKLFGVALIIVGICTNFALAFIYRLGGSSQQKAHQAAMIRALQQAASFTVERESTEAAMIESVEAIRNRIPEAARQRALDAQRAFLASHPSTNDQGNGRG